jgi:Cft2 family RNA processing exonuclease
MTTHEELVEQMREANSAASMLNNGVLRRAFEKLEQDNTRTAIFAQNDEERELARVMVLAVAAIRSELEQILQRGQLAVHLREQRQRAEQM